MIDDIKADAELRMGKSIDALKDEMAKVRTGRAHPSLLDHISVESYGSMVPLSQVANIGVEDSRTLTITPWERTMVQVIEKAIMTSDLGLNPNSAGTVIANGTLKTLQKDKDISEDDERRGQDEIQKLTDQFIKSVDDVLGKKEQDLMEI